MVHRTGRAGLDLLFSEEGGLCMALGETCCFSVIRPGVIREALTNIKENLHIREEERKQNSNWFEYFSTGPPGCQPSSQV